MTRAGPAICMSPLVVLQGGSHAGDPSHPPFNSLRILKAACSQCAEKILFLQNRRGCYK